MQLKFRHIRTDGPTNKAILGVGWFDSSNPIFRIVNQSKSIIIVVSLIVAGSYNIQ